MPAAELRPARPGRAGRGRATAAAMLWRYCATVLPCARRELRRWTRRARTIPDLELRAHACATLRDERANAEGAALLALAAPRARRPTVVRLLVSAQVLYDYLDTLSEQPAADPLAASRRLHRALLAVLAEAEVAPPAAADWYGGYRWGDDGGYLAALVAACRGRLAALPARAVVAPAARRAIERASESQSRNHAAMLGALDAAALADWAAAQAAAGRGRAALLWWELAAASASSLALHALLAAAADPRLTAAAAARLEAAYWPWTCALNTLLESAADATADAVTGNHSYVGRYPSPQAAAERLAAIAAAAAAAVRALPDGAHHATVLAAMACFYLEGRSGGGGPAPTLRRGVLAQLGLD
jgi:tetraprenyl-beta-curcumene synthase